ncbi:phage terminase-like large subunit protein [Mycobacteroides abscessus]|uniref:Phage terminase-like large subunit protein n=1 Tax=Mycobacteroides abscessus subsp. massiliense TaxID=1962118 RepID=A0AB38DIC0_9MYCO|nr:terminase [Mycobacteroides abscessus]QSM02026.1 terminase large subunit [Mycobacterium phage prophi68-1]QSM05071.1 terminase large subunit [Mycobacterium phage prophiGD04-1]AMU25530.1 terminase [Mycobacteroides abscessus]AMU35255.1 terminase [Mycobacteroides abscessus]AMU40258.1 terminase [Mycobacteroides abscessus]
MELIVPPDTGELFPTLGDQLCDFLEERACHGPGDLKGEPIILAEDWRYVLYRLYEHWPKGHPRAGRRRFKRGAVSWRKGSAKTEFMALVSYLELHPESPVRFNGFDEDAPCGLAQGRPVVDPYIPLLANTKDQVEELAYGALKVICEECVDADMFDAALDRILRIGEDGKADGKAVALANAPNSNDGGRTTFQGYDETHRLYLPNHKAAITTMEANLGKRMAQDPWSLSTTTAGEPGQNSQAEDDHFLAEAIKRGEVERPRMFYFHRQASDGWDLTKFEDRVEAIREASGPELAARTDLEDLAAQWDDPKADKSYLERVWTNRWTQQGAQAFNIRRWKALGLPGVWIPRRAFVTLGFDGARFRDATGLVVTDVRTGMQQKAYLCEKPLEAPEDWEVDEKEVDDAVREVFKTSRVLLMYADPPHWNSTIGDWAVRYGDSRITKRPIVQEFWTNKQDRMIKTIQAYADAIAAGRISHNEDDDGDLVRHVGNAGKHFLKRVDPETGSQLWILGKLHRDRKFDLCMASILSWQARMEVMGLVKSTSKQVFERIR